MNSPLFWRIPAWLGAVFVGVSLAGLLLAIVVPALGYLPVWLPWPVILGCVALSYWAFRPVRAQPPPRS